ncbi:hypothetical protein BDW72DRAFT_181639 [Aspergillus terricola var. indicus]
MDLDPIQQMKQYPDKSKWYDHVQDILSRWKLPSEFIVGTRCVRSCMGYRWTSVLS